MWASVAAAWNAFWALVSRRTEPDAAEKLLALSQQQLAKADARYDALTVRLESHIAAGESRHEALRKELESVHSQLRECRDKHAESEAKSRTMARLVADLRMQNKEQAGKIEALEAKGKP